MRLLTTRRAEWVPAVALLAAVAGVAAILGGGVRAWAFAAGVVAGAAIVGWVLRLRERRRSATPPTEPARGKLELVRGRESEYDLEKDTSTDGQRWLM